MTKIAYNPETILLDSYIATAAHVEGSRSRVRSRT